MGGFFITLQKLFVPARRVISFASPNSSGFKTVFPLFVPNCVISADEIIKNYRHFASHNSFSSLRF